MLQLGDLLQRGQCLQKAGVLLVKVGACGELAREQILRMLVVLLEDGEDRAGVVRHDRQTVEALPHGLHQLARELMSSGAR